MIMSMLLKQIEIGIYLVRFDLIGYGSGARNVILP
jgi:hypothetical protein